MFKKIFKKLTQSQEELFLEEMNQFAASVANQGSPQLGEVVRRFAQLKQKIDHLLSLSLIHI